MHISTCQTPPGYDYEPIWIMMKCFSSFSISQRSFLHQFTIHPVCNKWCIIIHHGPHSCNHTGVSCHQHPRCEMDGFVGQILVTFRGLASGKV
ncbi:hypothetical protein OPQ81_002428 [Rhizoctonia solani]|nr:hypothetical protein OPQ81_002428 [Rhizoctonia solani]